MNDWVALSAAVLGSGGLVALFNAIKDWRKGAAQRIEEAEQKHLLRLDTEVAMLKNKVGELEVYNLMLINTLIDNGIRVPRRESLGK